MHRHWLIAIFIISATLLQPATSAAQEMSLRRIIDDEIQAAWKQNNVKPAPRASDAAFLRRVYVDLAGTIPSWKEAKVFLDDRDPEKREGPRPAAAQPAPFTHNQSQRSD